jgi:hypothetical protein
MKNNFEFGKLYFVNNLHIVELYHIHTIKVEQKIWNIGDEISTTDFPDRVFNPETNYLKFDRERRFEIVRKTNYINYPSRNNCLFAITLEYLDLWKSKFQNRLSCLIQIAKIQLIEGKWIQLDDTHFDEHEGISNEELAQDFWSGNDFMEDSKPVILFEGKFKIVEIQM